MPSINKTPNAGLNQWKGNEYIIRQDWVDDNLAIDNKFKEIEDNVKGIKVPVVSVNGKTGAVNLTTDDLKAVPATRKVNNKALSGDITLAAADIKTNDGKTLEQFKTDTNASLDKITQDIGNIDDTIETPIDLQGKDLVTRVNEVFTSASNGKTKIANAITGKGVATSPNDTFDIMAGNINKLSNVTIDGEPVEGNIVLANEGYLWEFTKLLSDVALEFTGGKSVVFEDKIHLMGDIKVVGLSANYRRHYVYDGTKWVNISYLPFEFYGYSNAVDYEKQLHIMGTSYSGGSTQKQHYKWNGATWSNVGLLPQPPSGGTNVVVVFNGEIYALLYYYMLYKWDGTSWTLLLSDSANLGTTSFKVVVYNNEIHILGGTKHFKWSGTSWVNMSTLPFILNIGIAVVVNNKLQIMQYYGYTSDNKSYFYEWDGSTWTRKKDFEFPVDSNNSLVKGEVVYSFDRDIEQKGTVVYSKK